MNRRRFAVAAIAAVVAAAVVLFGTLTGRHKSPAPKPQLPVVHSQDECVALHGKWGPQGLLGHESCVLPTSDGGRECLDDSECQGSCRAPADAKPGNATIGHCTHTDAFFGCHALVRNGIASPMVCVD